MSWIELLEKPTSLNFFSKSFNFLVKSKSNWLLLAWYSCCDLSFEAIISSNCFFNTSLALFSVSNDCCLRTNLASLDSKTARCLAILACKSWSSTFFNRALSSDSASAWDISAFCLSTTEAKCPSNALVWATMFLFNACSCSCLFLSNSVLCLSNSAVWAAIWVSNCALDSSNSAVLSVIWVANFVLSSSNFCSFTFNCSVWAFISASNSEVLAVILASKSVVWASNCCLSSSNCFLSTSIWDFSIGSKTPLNLCSHWVKSITFWWSSALHEVKIAPISVSLGGR